MSDSDQSLYNIRYNQVTQGMEGFGGGTPMWTPLTLMADGGITQLHGDAAAGPGSGNQAITLATVNSNVGSFTNANITVNAKGLITAATNGAGGITQLHGDAAAGPGAGDQAITFATVNSNVGSFTNANITVNDKGLITAAANGTGGAPNFAQTSLQGTFATLASTDTTFTTLTGFLATITPSTMSSKIKVTVSIVCNPYGYTAEGQAYITVFDSNGTNVATRISGGMQFGNYATGTLTGSSVGTVCFSFIDAPGTTSPFTYTVKALNNAGDGNIQFGQSGSDTSTIILEEI